MIAVVEEDKNLSKNNNINLSNVFDMLEPYLSTRDLLDVMPKYKEVRNVPQYADKKEQGRNEKCNCGSGLKYKKCCGKNW